MSSASWTPSAAEGAGAQVEVVGVDAGGGAEIARVYAAGLHEHALDGSDGVQEVSDAEDRRGPARVAVDQHPRLHVGAHADGSGRDGVQREALLELAQPARVAARREIGNVQWHRQPERVDVRLARAEHGVVSWAAQLDAARHVCGVGQQPRYPGVELGLGGGARGGGSRAQAGAAVDAGSSSTTTRCVTPMPRRGVRMTSSSGGGLSPRATASSVAPERSGLPTIWSTLGDHDVADGVDGVGEVIERWLERGLGVAAEPECGVSERDCGGVPTTLGTSGAVAAVQLEAVDDVGRRHRLARDGPMRRE